MPAIEPIPDLERFTRRVDTDRFGPFVFRVGIDPAQVELDFPRVEDAHERFIASPLAQVANQLEREVVVSSVFGTNTIEGGTLSEDETADALALDPAQVKEIEQRRAVNIKAAYDLSRQAAGTAGWSLNREFILQLHRLITQGIPHPDNQPGQIRDNPKSRITYAGHHRAIDGRAAATKADADVVSAEPLAGRMAGAAGHHYEFRAGGPS